MNFKLSHENVTGFSFFFSANWNVTYPTVNFLPTGNAPQESLQIKPSFFIIITWRKWGSSISLTNRHMWSWDVFFMLHLICYIFQSWIDLTQCCFLKQSECSLVWQSADDLFHFNRNVRHFYLVIHFFDFSPSYSLNYNRIPVSAQLRASPWVDNYFSGLLENYSEITVESPPQVSDLCWSLLLYEKQIKAFLVFN